MSGALALALAALTLAGPVSAAVLSADFRTSFELPDLPAPQPRVLEANGRTVGDGPELTNADEVSNPLFFSGTVFTDLARDGLLRLIADDSNTYDKVVFQVSNLRFESPTNRIVGVRVLRDAVFEPSFGVERLFPPTIAFTDDSVTVTYDMSGMGMLTDLTITPGGESVFQLVLADDAMSVVPLPASLSLLVAGLGGLALVRGRRRG
jgi:hypothetical protein